jgi:prolyl-tRNA synthetase
VHASEAEAQEETLKILDIYKTFAEEYMAIPVLTGRKSDSEKFAGAVKTYAIEALMPDGKALQAGTSHHLGQNFAKAFNIRFESREQKLEYAWQTSWGVSTRLVGAVIMAHGDDSGLILPPRLAPIQAVIVPISAGNWQETVLPQARKVFTDLKNKGLRVFLDDRDAYTPGWKYADWEMRGVPVRIEIGPKDIEKQQVVLVNRLNRKKSFVAWNPLADELIRLLEEIQNELFNRAKAFCAENTHTAAAITELKNIMESRRGLIKTGWCGNSDCEAKVKQETSATIRVILDIPDADLPLCAVCGEKAPHTVVFAKSY